MKTVYRIWQALFAMLLLAVLATGCSKEDELNIEESGRPVWILGHGANCLRTLQSVIEEGGNGVEIDVNTNNYYRGSFWSVAHDVFVSPETMSALNAYLAPEDYWVSLETYLNYAEMDKICLLWLDNKQINAKYLKELVEYVHEVTDKRYNGLLPPYSIIYEMNYSSDLETITTSNENILEWLSDNLRPNEGINVSWEKLSEGDDKKISDLFSKYHFPVTKHLFSNGFHNSQLVSRNGTIVKDIEQAHVLRDGGEFCSRIGFWTAQSAWDAYWFLDKEATIKDGTIVNTDCDVVIVECHNNMVSPGDKSSLQDVVKDYMLSSGQYYHDYNNGRCRLAKQNDVFWKRY